MLIVLSFAFLLTTSSPSYWTIDLPRWSKSLFMILASKSKLFRFLLRQVWTGSWIRRKKKKKKTAQPRRGLNLGLPIAGRIPDALTTELRTHDYLELHANVSSFTKLSVLFRFELILAMFAKMHRYVGCGECFTSSIAIANCHVKPSS